MVLFFHYLYFVFLFLFLQIWKLLQTFTILLCVMRKLFVSHHSYPTWIVFLCETYSIMLVMTPDFSRKVTYMVTISTTITTLHIAAALHTKMRVHKIKIIVNLKVISIYSVMHKVIIDNEWICIDVKRAGEALYLHLQCGDCMRTF